MQRSDARKLQEEKLHRPEENLSLTARDVQADYQARHLLELKQALAHWKHRAEVAEAKIAAEFD